MQPKDFLVSIPHLCRAKNADRWARIIALQYDDEIKNPNGPFALNAEDLDDPRNRLETAFGFSGDIGRKDHCKNLAELLMLVHYRKEHGDTRYDTRINELAFVTEAVEEEYPDIAVVMSAETAATMGGWNA